VLHQRAGDAQVVFILVGHVLQHVGGQARIDERGAGQTGQQAAGPRLGGVLLDDDRTAGAQGRGRVAAESAVRQREVARAEDHDRPERHEHGADIVRRADDRKIRGAADRRAAPRPAAGQIGERRQCGDHAVELRRELIDAQRRLPARDGQDLIAHAAGAQARDDRAQRRVTILRRQARNEAGAD
jgi:hypothetical protein